MAIFKNKEYSKYAIPVLLLTIFLMYFYSGLQNDHLNALTQYYTQQIGWDATTVTNPVTVAGFVVIVAYLLVGTLMVKYGVKKILLPSVVITGLATIGLAFAGTNLWLYNISLFLVRLFVVPLQMGGFMLCTNWFIKYRGRALGFVTMGSPLCTATLIAGLTYGISSFGFTATYTVVGIVVLVLALLIALFIKSTPEEVGLNPDGAETLPEKTAEETNREYMPFKEVMANPGSWLLIISFGLLQFCIVAIMAFYVPRLSMVGTAPPVFLFWLSVAAIMGIPISYILGMIDDKFGTIVASLVLCLTFLVALIGLLVMKANQVPMIVMTAIGIAGVTGGTPNLHPSITAYVFGRHNYQAANRWIMSIQAIIMAFALYFMSYILDTTGSLDLGYQIMIGMVIVAAITLLIIGRKPDHDRGQALKAAQEQA